MAAVVTIMPSLSNTTMGLVTTVVAF